MRSPQVHIDSPCHESWEAMEGGAERRFCGVCDKHVHNLSAMRVDDARALLQASAGNNLCVRYSAESDGTLRFLDLVPAARLTRGLVRSAFAAALLAACTPTVEGPVADLGDVVIESIREATTPSRDGGCDYTTGPFTTFHFAPGHVLCRSTGHDDLALPPAITSTPALLPAPPPPLPTAEPDPIDRPMMGQAIAMPEPVEPFVPCDPKPTYAPPPPQFAAPPPPTNVRMGDIATPPPPAMGGISLPEFREPPPQDPGFAPPPPPRPGFAPPPPGFAPPPPPRPGFAPHPPPEPDDRPTMGSISPSTADRMGRIAAPR